MTKKTALKSAKKKTVKNPGEAPIVQAPVSNGNGNGEHMDFRAGYSKDELKTAILNHLKFSLARDKGTAESREWWLATCAAVRDRIVERFMATQHTHNTKGVRRAYYLSLEYLMGRMLRDNLFNAGLFEVTRDALAELDVDLDALCEEEPDMGLGNGGLGRLAACFLDSLATLDYPAIGYGIRYEFGLFRQEFADGHQVEHPDNWRQFGNPWEIVRPQYTVTVKLYGQVENVVNDKGDFAPQWINFSTIMGLPFDIPICGYGASTVNFLRLWESRATEEFNLEVFNRGGYVEAVREKAIGETISKVLYPNDKTETGKELRLVQQYFFVSCSLQDIIRRHFRRHDSWDDFADFVAIQLNDTHPAVAVPELMRLLLDEHAFSWDAAWGLCRKVFNYTNHTLLPEALERWSAALFKKVLPRHLEIIFEINRRFLEEEVEACWPGDDAKKALLSLIEEGDEKMIRMAYLSVVASAKVNGVAALHTQLLRENLFADFNELYPGKLINKTNGITPRRWLLACNPRLSALIDKTLRSKTWPKDLAKLRALEEKADDPEFQKAFMDIKHANKVDFAAYIKERDGYEIDPEAMFDVQIKRLHEYKRQHLNLLHILTLYRRLLHNPQLDIAPRVFIFAAKAAPGYDLAKNIIRAINKVGERINHDERIGAKLKIVFPQNYGVTVAEHIIPAADLSEQISTAGKEASGTGNMKLALNGALTVGTLDGANVEIREEVGEENIFIFGKRVEEVAEIKRRGYNPWDYYNGNSELRAVLDWLRSDTFAPGEKAPFDALCRSLLEEGDPYLVLADYAEYIKIQERIDSAYKDKQRWAKMAILNTARVGKFSSDRTISEYANEIWRLEAVKVP